ncbi:MAG: metallopeptidase family protein [Clostridiales bacterium]|nr:metallopeptidase family protein [Clostridiales bacterium]
MEYTFDQVGELLDEMAEEFPPVFFQELNGGILLDEEAKPDPLFPEGEVYFMGEYVQDGYLGRSIHLYYGSFLASARREDWSEETWQKELYTTLAHELTHHVESLANAHALDDKDEEDLLELMRYYQKDL